MGSEEHGEEEGPMRQVTVESFSVDRFDVTNAQFAKFVEETGYVTAAERSVRAFTPAPPRCVTKNHSNPSRYVTVLRSGAFAPRAGLRGFG
jgi:formylglycine-generating enzyme required for sulfatase activity